MDATRFFAAIIFVLTVVACGGGYEGVPKVPIDSSTLPLSVGSNTLTVVPGEMKRIEISGGHRPYSVNNPNSAVALASVSDNILTGSSSSQKDREQSFKDMMKIAFEAS